MSSSAPGVNGMRDGVAYVTSKDGYIYALDLTTGALIWRFKFNADGVTPQSRSTPAIVGDEVIFGESNGVYALNAVTGAPAWRWNGGTESLSAPAVVGPPTQRVVAVATIGGTIDVLDVSTGAVLYSFQTGGFSTSSVADVDGNLLASDSNGFLYDFAIGGGNAGAPTTTVTSPATGTTVPNPDGNLTVAGTASGAPIAAVNVAIQSGGTSGPWWDSATGTWTTGFFDNAATVASPGARTTGWHLALPVPTGGGQYRVLASAANTNGVADTSAGSPKPSGAQSTFTVAYSHSAPHFLSTTGAYVAPGASVVTEGSGFHPEERVSISLSGTVLATTTSTSTGTLPRTSVPIPETAVFGPASLVAAGASSDQTSLPIDISNEWSQSAHDSLHSGYEPHDFVMAQHVSPDNEKYFEQAWSFPSGSPVHSGVSVYEGVAYFGTDAGTVYALDVHNSQPLWTYHTGGAVVGTPATDSGEVIFGSKGHHVVALGAADGKVRWSDTTSSAVESPPAVVAGTVFIGSEDGTVYALNERTGAVLWHVTLGGLVKASPTVDPSQKLVVVGDASGAITALSTSDGHKLWSVPTGGPITATATIANGEVLVGSGDDKVYALHETTGTRVWTAATSGPVIAAGVIDLTPFSTQGGSYVVGDANGNVYYLNVTTGTLTRTVVVGSAVVGMASAEEFVAIETSAGVVYGFKPEVPGDIAWLYNSSAGFGSAPTVLNGVVYVTGEDFTLRAFTIPGRPIP